eukprot:7297117-Prymnesium_polylepis.1
MRADWGSGGAGRGTCLQDGAHADGCECRLLLVDVRDDLARVYLQHERVAQQGHRHLRRRNCVSRDARAQYVGSLHDDEPKQMHPGDGGRLQLGALAYELGRCACRSPPARVGWLFRGGEVADAARALRGRTCARLCERRELLLRPGLSPGDLFVRRLVGVEERSAAGATH